MNVKIQNTIGINDYNLLYRYFNISDILFVNVQYTRKKNVNVSVKTEN